MKLTLKQLNTAKQWYSAENNHDYVMADWLSARLADDGWEIGMDESGDSDSACFCVKQGDINGKTYIALGKRMLDVENNES